MTAWRNSMTVWKILEGGGYYGNIDPRWITNKALLAWRVNKRELLTFTDYLVERNCRWLRSFVMAVVK